MITLSIVSLSFVAARTAPTHDDEISAFASTMAIARTFAENCSGTKINDVYLEGLRQRLHVVDRDHPVFAERAREVVKSLKVGLTRSPHPEAWCANLYVLFGPNGTMIPGLLLRGKSP